MVLWLFLGIIERLSSCPNLLVACVHTCHPTRTIILNGACHCYVCTNGKWGKLGLIMTRGEYPASLNLEGCSSYDDDDQHVTTLVGT